MDQDIKKIDLNSPTDFNKQNFSRMRKKSKNNKNLIIALSSFFLLLILFIVFAIYLPVSSLAKKARLVLSDAKLSYSALKRENINLTSQDLAKAQVDILDLKKQISSLGYLRFIPIVNLYYSDGYHLVNAGIYGLDSAQILVSSISPYADVLGFKGQGSFTGGSADQRIQTAVETLGKITPNIDKISQNISLVKKELDQVDPNHYPSIWKLKTVKTNLEKAKTIVDDGASFLNQATPLVKVLPSLLGDPIQQKYLILFQNDKELRPTGGFMTGYSILAIDHGKINYETSNDIYTLDNTIKNKPVAPAPILNYLPKVYQLNLRDSNLSPDFGVSMKAFNSLYKRAGDYAPVNGIIAIDTYPLIDAIRILGGEITVDGITFNIKINPICNCADAVYQLELASDKPTNHIRTNRKGILGDLMKAILNKALSSSPKLYWGPLFQSFVLDTAQKHILFDLYNADAQNSLTALNATGQVRPFNGDYFYFNEANFGGQKSNLFVNEKVNQNYSIDLNGVITKTVTVDYKNPFPPSNCSLASGDLCLNATLRDWFRVYVPQASKLISYQGSEVKMKSYSDLGKTVFEGFLTVRPMGIAKLTFSYQLPFKVKHGSSLPVLFQKQPGTGANEYSVVLNNNQITSFGLSEDKIINLKP